jgi:hypothetical protein
MAGRVAELDDTVDDFGELRKTTVQTYMAQSVLPPTRVHSPILIRPPRASWCALANPHPSTSPRRLGRDLFGERSQRLDQCIIRSQAARLSGVAPGLFILPGGQAASREVGKDVGVARLQLMRPQQQAAAMLNLPIVAPDPPARPWARRFSPASVTRAR